MSQVCAICGKGKTMGGSITRRGMAKKKGGIGTHVVKDVKRCFAANLQTVHVSVNGTNKRIHACTACIRSGKIVKA